MLIKIKLLDESKTNSTSVIQAKEKLVKAKSDLSNLTFLGKEIDFPSPFISKETNISYNRDTFGPIKEGSFLFIFF